jgi:hypothetical protein
MASSSPTTNWTSSWIHAHRSTSGSRPDSGASSPRHRRRVTDHQTEATGRLVPGRSSRAPICHGHAASRTLRD